MKGISLGGLAVVAIIILFLSACTDAQSAKAFNYGQTGRVTCYSGGQVYLDDFSTGRIEKNDSSGADGFYFVSQSTNRLTEASGDCVVDYGVRPTANFAPTRR